MEAKLNSLSSARRHAFIAQHTLTTRLLPISGWYVLFMMLADFAVTEVALGLAALLRNILPFGPILHDEGQLTLLVYLIAPLVVVGTYVASGLYRPEQIQSTGREIQVALRSTVISTIMLAGLLYFLEREISRWLFLYYGLLQIVLMVGTRMSARGVCRLAHVPLTAPRRIAIVGAGEIGRAVATHLGELDPRHYRVIGFIDADCTTPSGVAHLPVLGALDYAENVVRAWKIDELLVTLPLHARMELAQLMQAVHNSPVQVSVIPDYFDLAYLYARADELADIPIVRLKEPVLSPVQRTIKRVFDIVLSGALLVISTPILLASALAVWLDSPGAVFYRQRRIGEGGRSFWMWKFRTMKCDADRHEKQLVKRGSGSVQFDKRPDDPRVTSCGRILRRWSIDELPQLVNVLKGDMSLIGPRPELPALVEGYSDMQRKRFAVPQGMTGWWQVNGRPQNVEQKVEYDLYYVRNYSVWLDAWILLKTISAVFGRRGAF